MTLIRAVVADDDAEVRSLLVALLRSDDRFDVVGEAADGGALLEVVVQTRPDVVLLDVRMPGGGEEAARALQDLPPVVVAVSAEAAPGTVAALVRAGVRGYLAKGRLGPTLPDQVARCVHGEVILGVPTAAVALRQLIVGS